MKTVFSPIVIFLMVSLAIFISSCEFEKLPPKQVISHKQANILEEEFKEARARIINESLGYEDTREFWFSLDSLKRYIEYVEYEAGKQGLNNLGVRVYYGVYPQNGQDQEQAGYATVFFVPTSLKEVSPLKQGFAPILPTNENIEGIDVLNYGHGGIPPNDL